MKRIFRAVRVANINNMQMATITSFFDGNIMNDEVKHTIVVQEGQLEKSCATDIRNLKMKPEDVTEIFVSLSEIVSREVIELTQKYPNALVHFCKGRVGYTI